MTFDERVYTYLTTIPYGKVVTYGQIATALGNPYLARAVGNSLHRNTDGWRYPCFKVVNHNGCLAKNFGLGGIEEQQRRLESEGIEVVDGRVDLKRYQWRTE